MMTHFFKKFIPNIIILNIRKLWEHIIRGRMNYQNKLIGYHPTCHHLLRLHPPLEHEVEMF